jgi:nicotinate-nucleotide pyrophosphorylase (carboxylating)
VPATDLNALPLPVLYSHFHSTGLISRLIDLARDEDLGLSTPRAHPGEAAATQSLGDITTAACIDPHTTSRAQIVARAPGVIAGLAALPDLVRTLAPGCSATPHVADGARVPANTNLCDISGPLDEMLEFERTTLNLLSRLSGIATRTAQFVAAIPPGSRARLYDTRKTTPGLRVLEKYAVRCGGGFCHRIGLYDAVLIKDNHLAGVPVRALAAFIHAAAARARSIARHPIQFIEVEVDSLDQFAELLTLEPGTIDIVLLDNMGPPKLREAAAMRDSKNPRLQLEASGGITLATLPEIATTGIDRISTGSITHSAVALDLAMDVVA